MDRLTQEPEVVPYGTPDPRFPGRGREGGPGNQTPAEALEEEIRKKYHTSQTANRDHSIQRLVDPTTDAHLTEYPTREDTDQRQYIGSFFQIMWEDFGYSPDGKDPSSDGSIIHKFINDFDKSMIPFKRKREEVYGKSVLGPDNQQDDKAALSRLLEDRGRKPT